MQKLEIKESWILGFIVICSLLLLFAQIGTLLMAYESSDVIYKHLVEGKK